MSRVLAIDPGRKGALVVLDDGDGSARALWQALTATLCPREVYRPVVMADAIRSVVASYGIEWAVLETQGARAGEGRTACFTTGAGWGLWRGILACMPGVAVIEAKPSVWVPAILGDVPLAGKKRSIFRARQIPGLDLVPPGRRAPQDGVADAACMGLWGLRRVAS